MTRQVEVADDLGTEQAHDVGEDRELEAREDLLGDRRAADQVAALEHEHRSPGAREVRRGDEPVVPAADDDRVVPVRAGSGALPLRVEERQSAARARAARLRRCSTVTSIVELRCPAAPHGASTCASARYCLSSGDQHPLVA